MVDLYSTNEQFTLKMTRMLVLVFITINDIPATYFNQLKAELLSEATEVVRWFKDSHAYGRLRRRNQRNDNVIRADFREI